MFSGSLDKEAALYSQIIAAWGFQVAFSGWRLPENALAEDTE
ncbi:hypothetical protein [Eikenella corrodens]|nr:hypothetical protein [Eikenella corrodens]